MTPVPCQKCGLLKLEDTEPFSTDKVCSCAQKAKMNKGIGNSLTGYLRRVNGQPDTYACNCRGPQNGQPVCPCMMRDVRIIDGRYVRVTDLGPAPNGGLPDSMLKYSARTPEKKVTWRD